MRTAPQSLAHLQTVAEAFQLPGPVQSVTPLGNGNVNATFLVEAGGQRYVLQRLNTTVFRQPELVMGNLQALQQHVDQRLQSLRAAGEPVLAGRRWELPQVICSRDGDQPWHCCQSGGFWRTLTFVNDSRSVEVIQHRQQARELGWGLGLFHHLISDLPVERLADTLEGFHITPRYVEAYHRALVNTSAEPCDLSAFCLRFIAEREAGASALEEAKARGELPLRPIHGDPKINNMLLDRSTGAAIALIDLDTVKPGLVHTDIGDCLRSCCNRLGEETEDFQAVRFDLDLAAAILDGYLSVAGAFLTPAELHYIPLSTALISFELGLRFFTDHLNGNTYFRADHPRHNLHRAVVQFQLAASIEAQTDQLQQLVQRHTAALSLNAA
jgi:Ser/Thr protein kinase RdoA (MazF antagonist)